jgi:hypothetical protein
MSEQVRAHHVVAYTVGCTTAFSHEGTTLFSRSCYRVGIWWGFLGTQIASPRPGPVSLVLWSQWTSTALWY